MDNDFAGGMIVTVLIALAIGVIILSTNLITRNSVAYSCDAFGKVVINEQPYNCEKGIKE